MKYLERLSQDPAGDDGLRLELAKAYHRIGTVQGKPSEPNLGDRGGALKSLTKAIDLLQPLTLRADVPRDAGLEYGRVQLTFASTAAIDGARDAAQSAAAEAASIAERIAGRDPKDDEARRLVGSALFQTALLTDDPDSLPIWRRAGEVFDAMLAERPGDPDRQRNVALVQKYIGSYWDRQQDTVAALRHHRRALELDEQRLAANPSNRVVQFDVAVDLSSVGHGEIATGRLIEAARVYERSLSIRSTLAESDPKDVLARAKLAYAHSRLGFVNGELRRTTQALDHARRAVALFSSIGPLDLANQRLFAESLDVLGRVETLAGHQDAACRAFQQASAGIAKIDPNKASEPNSVRVKRPRSSRRILPDASRVRPRS